jgi:pyridoxal phosphate enzyme (YggS family)
MTAMRPEELAANLAVIGQRIGHACDRAGRDPGEIRLLAVTKGHSPETVRVAVECGLRAFGENRVQEGLAKKRAMTDVAGLEWHMIGHIQSRKASRAVEGFDVLQSVDSLELAVRLDRAAARSGKKMPVLLECNVSGEASKSGWRVEREGAWMSLADEFRGAADLTHLSIGGLMTMAPYGVDPESARILFDRLARLRDYLRGQVPGSDWRELSMGMSDDYEPAIEAGATIIRLGRAIFGERVAASGVPAG